MGQLFIILLMIYTNSFIGNFYFLSHSNYHFSNLLLLFIKYLIVCNIQLNNSHTINVTSLDLLIYYCPGSRWFCQIRIWIALRKELLYERSGTPYYICTVSHWSLNKRLVKLFQQEKYQVLQVTKFKSVQ